jgi:two-component system chemotaxis response regulator CheB
MDEKKIKVLIVEDTLVAQKLLKGLVNSDSRFELVGVAENGKQAYEFVDKYKPDVVSMDILMPIMDGVAATKMIMQNSPVPIVIVSSFYNSTEVEMAMKVLQAGAVTILPRPYGPGHSKYLQSTRKYLNTLQIMSEIKVVRRNSENKSVVAKLSENTTTAISEKTNLNKFHVLAIGASAGGPQGLSTILNGLPSDFPLPVFIVQHIDSNFAEGFAEWLNTYSKLPVKIALDGEKISASTVYMPPPDCHLLINTNETIKISKVEPYKGLRPSVDLLFKSIASVYKEKAIVVLLSGMGKDGALEMKNLYNLGAYTIAQEETSCLVYGMPGEAAKIGAVCKLLSPENITKEILHLNNI